MKRLAAILALLLLAIQWPLWFGRGGWLRVWDLQHQLDSQRSANSELDARSTAMSAELRSLEQGREAVEEHAREDLHLMRSDEIFFQQPGPLVP
ncbi:MAG: cell division protein FtsB [Betaproteobacteria bacterium]|nr:MAG: cell division protein FtsB [Betaproteobacteria bacterium]